MVSARMILSLGFIFGLRSPPVRPCVRALGWFGACLCFAKPSETLFCEIVGDPWSFLEEFRWVLIRFPEFFKGFKDFTGFLGAAGPPVSVVPLASVFTLFCVGFKGGRCEIEVKKECERE